MTEDFIITARDLQAKGFCIVPGVKNFFRNYDLDFRDFMKNGIMASALLATGDGMARKAVELVGAGRG